MRCFILVPLDWPDSHALEHLCARVEGQHCCGIHSRTVQQPQGQALHKGKRSSFGGAVVNGTRDGWQGQDRVQANYVSILQLQHPWQERFGGLKSTTEGVRGRKGLLSRDTTKTTVPEKNNKVTQTTSQTALPIQPGKEGSSVLLLCTLWKLLNRKSLYRGKPIFPSVYISSSHR